MEYYDFIENKINDEYNNNCIEYNEYLRQLRDLECFPIINRGQFWYDNLTMEQKQELKTWYINWLNVTVTKEIPTKPEWLK